MIGVLSGAGRMALTNALSQVARSFGREAMQRIMQGEAKAKPKVVSKPPPEVFL